MKLVALILALAACGPGYYPSTFVPGCGYSECWRARMYYSPPPVVRARCWRCR